MKSLPAESKFSIISCGSVDSLFSEDKFGEQGLIFDLNDQTIKLAMGLIKNMPVKPGDARVFEHIKEALTDQQYDSGKVKRVFILSYGNVQKANEICQIAAEHSDSARVFSFGLGADCDTDLLTSVARAGRGTFTSIDENSTDSYDKVNQSLSDSMEPRLKGAQYGWSGENLNHKEIYHNTLVSLTKLCSKSEFQSIQFFFRSEEDPAEQLEKIDLTFTAADFKRIEDEEAAQAFFKMVVSNAINNTGLSSNAKERLSLKHQVLCDETAIIGVKR